MHASISAFPYVESVYSISCMLLHLPSNLNTKKKKKKAIWWQWSQNLPFFVLYSLFTIISKFQNLQFTEAFRPHFSLLWIFHLTPESRLLFPISYCYSHMGGFDLTMNPHEDRKTDLDLKIKGDPFILVILKGQLVQFSILNFSVIVLPASTMSFFNSKVFYVPQITKLCRCVFLCLQR